MGAGGVAMITAVHDIHWAAITTVGATVVLVAVTGSLVWATTRYLKPSITLAREAVRARVDQQAPRVVVTSEDNPNVYYHTDHGEPQPARAAPPGEASSRVLRVPANDHVELLVRTKITVRNEGHGSGYVSVEAESPVDQAGCSGGIRVLPPYPVLLQPLSLAHIAGVQTILHFTVELKMTVEEWRASASHVRHISIMVSDLFDDGVEDSIPLTIAACAVVTNQNDAGQALIRLDPPPIVTQVGRSLRTYRGERTLTGSPRRAF